MNFIKKYFIYLSIIFLTNNYVFARSLSEIKKSGYINACFVPWLGTTSREEIYGADYESAKIFAKYIGVRQNYKMIKWDEQFKINGKYKSDDMNSTPDLLSSEKCDYYASNITKRASFLNYLEIVRIFPSRMLIISLKKNVNKIHDVSDLGGKSVYVIKNTTYEKWLLQQNRTILKNNPIIIHSIEDGNTVDYLLQEKADFIILDTYLAFFSKENKSKDISFLLPVGATEDVGWGFNPNDKDLILEALKFFSQETNTKTSDINKIFKKFYGADIKEISEITFSISSN